MAFILLQWALKKHDLFFYRSIKILKHFNYNINEIGNFYRWYSGVTINTCGKVTNRNNFTTRFVLGQIANNIVPYSGTAISIMRLFDSTFREQRDHYQEWYQSEFEKQLPNIRTWIEAEYS